MRKRFRELAFLVVASGVLCAFTSIIFVSKKPVLTFANPDGFWNILLLVMASLLYASVSASCGYVFGVNRGKGRMIEAEDLIPGKPFKIVKMEILNGNMTTLVTIEIGGRRRLCLCLSSVPSSATHLNDFVVFVIIKK